MYFFLWIIEQFSFSLPLQGIAHAVYGPIPGNRHDAYLFASSGWYRPLGELAEFGRQHHPENMQLNVFADSAFPNLPGLIPATKKPRNEVDPAARQFSKALNWGRSEIEHFFAAVCNTFPLLYAEKNLKCQLRRVPVMFPVAVFLYNCLVCSRGRNQVSTKFECAPPVLETYLAYCAQREQAHHDE